MTTEQKLREAFRPMAHGMPESIEQFQLALDAAYLAGQKVAEARSPAPEQQRSMLSMDRPMTFGGCPYCGSQRCVAGQCQHATPEQGDTHQWPQQGDQGWPPAPEAAKRTVGGEITKEWCMRMAMLEVETGADMEAGVQAPEAAKTEKERAEFEAEYRLMFPASSADPEKFEQNGTGGYEDFQVNNAWRFWQARASRLAADSKAGGEPVELTADALVRTIGTEWPEFMAPLRWLPSGTRLYTRPQQQAKPLTVPFDVEFAASYLDGVMEVDQPEIQSKWAKVRTFLSGIGKDQA